jgi:hypothetical protein
MHPNTSSLASRYALSLGAFILLTFTSCVDYTSGPGMASVGVYSDYSYYPRYGTYYSPQSRQYYYQRGSTWQTRSSPYGVSNRTLLASPYVPLNLHSHPSNHHASVSQSYPHNWSPPSHSGHSGHGHSSSSHRR